MPIKLNGSSSGYTQIEAASVAGNNTLTLPTASGTLMTTGGTNTFTANQVIEVTDNTNAALRITQLGTGAAIRVEDEANPDSTPFVVDASGNVGVGTSSPSARLDVRGGDGTGGISGPTSGTWASQIVMNQDAIGYSGLSVQSRWATDTTPVFEVASGWNGSAAGYYPVYTVNGTGLAVWKSNSGTERMRVDSSGNVLIGTTDTSENTGNGIKLRPDGGTPRLAIVGNSVSSSLYPIMVRSSSNSTFRFYVDYAGNIYAQNTAIIGLSDERLKENIQDIDRGLAQIMALKPRKFDWKDGKGRDKKGDRGWIAQEFEQVFPDMVTSWSASPDDEGTPYKAVQADLIPVLVKAIQELSAKNDALEARIASLENA